MKNYDKEIALLAMRPQLRAPHRKIFRYGRALPADRTTRADRRQRCSRRHLPHRGRKGLRRGCKPCIRRRRRAGPSAPCDRRRGPPLLCGRYLAHSPRGDRKAVRKINYIIKEAVS